MALNLKIPTRPTKFPLKISDYRRKVIAATHTILVAVKADGTVVYTTLNNTTNLRFAAQNVVSVVASVYRMSNKSEDITSSIYCLRNDGSVCYFIYSDTLSSNFNVNECNITDVVDIAAGGMNIFFLKSDGTVWNKYNNCIYSTPHEIVKIFATNSSHDGILLGLKVDGTVVFLGNYKFLDLRSLFTDWTDIVDVASSNVYLSGSKSLDEIKASFVGLKADGTVVNCATAKTWENVVQLSTTIGAIMGLKTNGSVYLGLLDRVNNNNNNIIRALAQQTDVVAVSAGSYINNIQNAFCVKANGTVYAKSVAGFVNGTYNTWTGIAQPSFIKSVYGYYQPSTNKLFTVKDGALTAVCDSWSQLVGDDKTPIIEQCTDTVATIAMLKPLGDFKLYSFLADSDTTCKAQFTVIEKPVTMKPKTLLSTIGYGRIKKIAMSAEFSNLNIKVLCTTDLTNYKYYDTSAKDWKTTTDFSKGMSINALNTLDDVAIASLMGEATDIAFGFYFEPTAITATYNFSLGVQGQKDGSWKRAVHGTDYDYGYPFNDTLRIEIKANGDYKVNYTKI